MNYLISLGVRMESFSFVYYDIIRSRSTIYTGDGFS